MGPLLGVLRGSPTLLGLRSDFLMIFGRFLTSFGEPWPLIFDTFRVWFSASFWRRFQDSVSVISAPFWEPFGGNFRYFSETPGFSDFCNPFYAKTLFLRVPAPPFSHFCGVFSGAGFRNRFLDVFGRFWDPRGLPFGACGLTLEHLF